MRDYSFGNFLHELRVRRGLSQYQLGMLVGVSNKAVSKWENGSAKPQSRILYQLSEVLGITVDELLACKYRSTDNKNIKGVFAMKNALWKKAHETLKSLYGNVLPIEVANRYFSEYAELKDTDQIVYFEFLRRMAKAGEHNEGDGKECIGESSIERNEGGGKKCNGESSGEYNEGGGKKCNGESSIEYNESGSRKCSGEYNSVYGGWHMRINGGIGASFVAYLMGATQINPLRPHYYCPDCHKIRFVGSVLCGWDLPAEKCSCGRELVRDGHNIPFETLRPIIYKAAHYDISVSQNLYQVAKGIISSYFEGNKVVTLIRKDPNVRTYAICAADCFDLKDGQEVPFEEYYDRLKQYPTITLMQNEELDACGQLEKESGVSFEMVPFTDKKVLDAFLDGNTRGIPEYKSDFARAMIAESAPGSIHDLIQISGLCHGTGVWEGNGQTLVKTGHPLSSLIAWRDDVFHKIQGKMKPENGSGTGYAYQVMENVRRGVYARTGMPAEIRQQLLELGVEEWLIDSFGKIQYVFPKAHGIAHVKYAMIFMWYKIYYPDVFDKIILGGK